jgi:phage shock protein A
MADIGMSVERAENKTADMKARSAALDELIEQGTLADMTSSQDDIERELAKISGKSSVDAELAKLKGEVRK